MSYRKEEGFTAVCIEDLEPGDTFVFNGYLWVFMAACQRKSGRTVYYAKRAVDEHVRCFFRTTVVFI